MHINTKRNNVVLTIKRINNIAKIAKSLSI